MNKRNYQKELDRFIGELQAEGRVPRLLLHACCAPCSSYCLEYLSQYMEITVFYYNPNITDAKEYSCRVSEEQRLIRELPAKYPISFLEGEYCPDRYFQAVKGHEKDPEGGDRCTICFEQRLEESARIAKEGGFDFFTTTLTISPLKDAERLNRIGEEMGEKFGIAWLNSDFKKKNGYRRSTELSKEYGLYRQNYCGCVFSKRDAMEREQKEAGDSA